MDCSSEAPVIGCQWFTWSPEGGEHFRWALAPARTFFASAEVSGRHCKLPGPCQRGPSACVHMLPHIMDMRRPGPPSALLQAVQALVDDGQLQGGPDYVSIIGDGDDWCAWFALRGSD